MAPRHTPAQRLALEIHAVADRVVRDRPFLLEAWSAWRERQPLLEALATTWPAWPVEDLLALDAKQLLHVTVFFEEVARVTTWARTTDAMPATLETRWDLAVERLTPLAEAAVTSLGGLPPSR